MNLLPPRLRSERGAALLIVLLLSMIILGAGGMMIDGVALNVKEAGIHLKKHQAYLIADAGLNKAIWWFNEVYRQPEPAATSLDTTIAPVRWTNGATTAPLSLPSHHPDSYTDCAMGTSQSGIVSSFQDNLVNQSFNGGTFSVVAEKMISVATDCAGGGTATQDEMWQIRSTATYRGLSKTVVAIVRRQYSSRWNHAVFSKSLTQLEKSRTQSFDSSTGTYDPTTGTWSNTCACNADVGTTATTTDSLNLKDSTTVNGNATPGPNAVSDAVHVSGGSVVTGSTSPATGVKDIPDPPLPFSCDPPGCVDYILDGSGTATIDPGNYDHLTVMDTAVLTMNPGDYEATAVNLRNDAQLLVNGPVIVTVRETVLVDPNTKANEGGAPTNLNLVVANINSDTSEPTSTNADVVIKTKKGFFGTVYAPNAKIYVDKDARIHGGLIGDRVRLKDNPVVSYDDNLRTTSARLPGDLLVVYFYGKP